MSYPLWEVSDMKLMPLRRRAFARLLGALIAAPVVGAAVSIPRTRIGPVVPVTEVPDGDETLAAFVGALSNERPVTVYYHGGSTPGALRRFRPTSIYRLRPGGPVYASGLCELRGGTRLLRLDRARLA